ncbi:MAG: RHS repeat-associated core domain-containing protein, partial [Planctomycetes bacterium]|nr:RHS repeat-associated core domain-containing protein [Planctomycetota bacterium]
DDAGNLTQDGDENGDHKYTWDYRNRLIEVEEKQSGNWVTVAEYTYDARSRRVLKVVTNKESLNGTTRYIWGGDSDWQCLEELDGSDDLVARYTYAPGYIDSPAVQERDLNSDDDFTDDDEVVYYHSNTLASIYALTDARENVIERYRYDAYGAATVLDADFSADADNASDVKNPYLFTARRLESESALMQYRNRYYDGTLGRFISRDSAGYADGFNLYPYVTCRPVNLADPLGLAEGKCEWGCRIGLEGGACNVNCTMGWTNWYHRLAINWSITISGTLVVSPIDIEKEECQTSFQPESKTCSRSVSLWPTGVKTQCSIKKGDAIQGHSTRRTGTYAIGVWGFKYNKDLKIDYLSWSEGCGKCYHYSGALSGSAMANVNAATAALVAIPVVQIMAALEAAMSIPLPTGGPVPVFP